MYIKVVWNLKEKTQGLTLWRTGFGRTMGLTINRINYERVNFARRSKTLENVTDELHG
jgi:hypothetical protein